MTKWRTVISADDSRIAHDYATGDFRVIKFIRNGSEEWEDFVIDLYRTARTHAKEHYRDGDEEQALAAGWLARDLAKYLEGD